MIIYRTNTTKTHNNKRNETHKSYGGGGAPSRNYNSGITVIFSQNLDTLDDLKSTKYNLIRPNKKH